MNIGLSTYTFPWAVGVEGYLPEKPMTLRELVHRCAAEEVTRLQIGDNLPLHALPEAEWLDALQRARLAGIQLEVGTRRLEVTHLRRYLPLARRAQSPFLRVVIDEGAYQPGEAEVVRIIRELLPELKESRVRLGIENHDRFPAASLQRIIEATDFDWVGICLDTSNSLGAGEGLEQVVSVLAPYVLNLHYKDIQIRRVSHKMGFTVAGCCPGTGLIGLDYLLEKLRPYGRCESITLEQWPPFTGTLDETLAQEREWATQGVRFLKEKITSISK